MDDSQREDLERRYGEAHVEHTHNLRAYLACKDVQTESELKALSDRSRARLKAIQRELNVAS